MNIKEIEKVVAAMQSHLFRNSNSYSVGMFKSHFKGAGLQFKEHQLYTPGDDVRFIDWKLSAKSDNTFIKTFEEERNIEIVVVFDITATMLFGHNGTSKLQASIEIACLLYLLAEKSKDKVKVIVFLDRPYMLPSFAGKEGIAFLVSYLEKIGILSENGKVNVDYPFDKEVSEERKMKLIKSFIARGKELVFLSDFSTVNDFETLNKLTYRRNMHCFKVSSPIDESEKTPFSVFGKHSGKTIFAKLLTDKPENKLKGKWKKLMVNDRYLEGFIREML